MKIVCISDTHGQHEKIEVPEGDLLIHAGDVSVKGTKAGVASFLHWFSQLNFKYKIFVAGNHDWFFERESKELIDSMIPENVVYLNDSGINIEGINIWGSPVQPWFYDWAFNRKRGETIAKHWKLIPENTDILITHGPPYSILDASFRGTLTGCEDLLKTVQKISPKLHIFGHIHEAYGQIKKDNTLFVNASTLNLSYQVSNEPVIIDY